MLLTQALSSCLVTHTRVHIWKSNWQSEKSVGILKCSESERGDLADHPEKSPCTKQFQYEQFQFVYWKITSFWKFAERLVVLSPQRPYLVWDMQAFPHGRHAELICFRVLGTMKQVRADQATLCRVMCVSPWHRRHILCLSVVSVPHLTSRLFPF